MSAAGAPPVRARLFARAGRFAGTDALIGEEARLGRGQDNDVVLADPAVSSRHGRIFYDREEGCYRIEDLGSRNGLRVAGLPVGRPEKLGRLDVVEVGRVGELVFQVLAAGVAGQDSPETAVDLDAAGAMPPALGGAGAPSGRTFAETEPPLLPARLPVGAAGEPPAGRRTIYEELGEWVLPPDSAPDSVDSATAGVQRLASLASAADEPVPAEWLAPAVSETLEPPETGAPEPPPSGPVAPEPPSEPPPPPEVGGRTVLDSAFLGIPDLPPASLPPPPSASPASPARPPEPVPAAEVFVLEVDNGSEGVVRFRLEPGEHVLGRGDDADLVVESPTLSRSHARLLVGAHGLSIVDLGSTNGTSVGGVELAPGEAVAVPPGSELVIGQLPARLTLAAGGRS